MTRDDTLVALSAVAMRRLIGNKQVSPVELMQACIARSEALNPGVNATGGHRLRPCPRRGPAG